MKYNFENIKSGKDYVEHSKRLKEDNDYLMAYKEYRNNKAIEYWKNMKPFKDRHGVPSLPKPLTDFHINKLIELGAIPKDKLEIDNWYYGNYRNSSYGKWDGKKFHIIRNSFNQWYRDECFHFQDDDGFALFVPLREATPEEIEAEENKLKK